MLVSFAPCFSVLLFACGRTRLQRVDRSAAGPSPFYDLLQRARIPGWIQSRPPHQAYGGSSIYRPPAARCLHNIAQGDSLVNKSALSDGQERWTNPLISCIILPAYSREHLWSRRQAKQTIEDVMPAMREEGAHLTKIAPRRSRVLEAGQRTSAQPARMSGDQAERVS